MSSVLVCLDKTGDIINLLPLLQDDSDTRLMVLREYAPLFSGISYSKPILFDGQFHELSRAMEEARAITPDVRSVTFTGDPETIKKFTFSPAGTTHATASSFAKESWTIAGRIDLWNEQPKLVFDRRSPEREAALLESVCPIKRGRKRKLMLVSAGGTSSPLQHRELLWMLLRLQFGRQYQIVDLSAIKAERFFDLLALYERADVLISTDSAPLHLAQACPALPVVAFVNDKPTFWFGSPWRTNYLFHCRYSEFPDKAVEILDVIETRSMPEPITVVLPFCVKDEALMMGMLQWMAQLSGTLPRTCVLHYDDTVADDSAIREAASKCFQTVLTSRYKAPKKPFVGWPSACNYAFQRACMFSWSHLPGPWLWCEPDCVPVKRDWLYRIESEYRAGGKPFMGSVIADSKEHKFGHVNGTAVYPKRAATLIPNAIASHKLAFDYAMRDEMIHLAHDAKRIMMHAEGKTFDAPALDTLMASETVLFHPSKDLALTNQLRERQTSKHPS
jgi:hypothetical protein